MMEKSSLATAFDTLPDTPESDGEREYLLRHAGAFYAGRHLLVDLWDGENLSDANVIDAALRRGAEEAGATLLHIHLHEFTENGGVSGVAVLAESHISIHTWPERDYAALDVFMCGGALPHLAIPVLKRAFEPTSVQVGDHKRGVVA